MEIFSKQKISFMIKFDKNHQFFPPTFWPSSRRQPVSFEPLPTDLVDFSIKKVLSVGPVRLEVADKKAAQGPECGSLKKTIKASFWRELKSIPQQGHPVMLLVYCHQVSLQAMWQIFQYAGGWNQKMESLDRATEA